ncbi:hypothetical protein SAMN02799631_00389 [Methylobacterium sp. 174MFSha1.1]|uniref:hypothetical protein n=1 Tax=Methylobacterium sp. 174MFSha1.1 TaxID=1502749 RepID=UPI0008F3F71B|nr:hypothetical protein [Methylobacterium sp. 174MFSha1.1]SFU38891.1 hypothetical protein SAMN02799631_00389 [Methylobacterium sp. 174MFSha1.1]
MRLFATALALTLMSSSVYAIDPFELQCSKAFDKIADTRVGASWAGANKDRYCRCMKTVFSGSADDLFDYNFLADKPDRLGRADWKCYVDSDRTTKSKFRP